MVALDCRPLALLLVVVLLGGCASAFAPPPAPPPVSRETLARQWFEIGNLYAELGDLPEAEAAYQQSLALGMDQRARHNLGLVQIRMGMESLASAREGRVVDPDAQRNTREYLQSLLNQVGAPALPQVSEPSKP